MTTMQRRSRRTRTRTPIATDRFELLIRSGKVWTSAGRFPTRRRAAIEARRILGQRFHHDFLARYIIEDRERGIV